MSNKICFACGGTLSRGLSTWHSRCAKCKYESSDLLPAINSSKAHEAIDEESRATGLRDLRMQNFRILMNALTTLKPNGGRLLEVGCAHGWFLDAAKNHFEVLGIEPDQAVFESASDRQLQMRLGYFPDVLRNQEKFDVIVFNDVFEHIPDCTKILEACHERLNEDGMLVLNLPSSDGIFYKASKVFKRLGQKVFFNRLWQKGMPSPHLHYFNPRNLSQLLKANSFKPVKHGTLPVLSLSGLYTRISYAGNLSAPSKAVVYGCVALALPVLKVLPSDIIYTIVQKQNKQNDD